MEKYVQIADEGAMIVMGRYEQQPQEQSAYQSEATAHCLYPRYFRGFDTEP